MAKRIYNNKVYEDQYMSSSSKGKWFKIKFDDDGLANFWINSSKLDCDLDLYVYEDEDRDSERLGRSIKEPGEGDDIVRDVSVKSGRYYYIYVKNLDKESCRFDIKAKVYPTNNPESKMTITKRAIYCHPKFATKSTMSKTFTVPRSQVVKVKEYFEQIDEDENTRANVTQIIIIAALITMATGMPTTYPIREVLIAAKDNVKQNLKTFGLSTVLGMAVMKLLNSEANIDEKIVKRLLNDTSSSFDVSYKFKYVRHGSNDGAYFLVDFDFVD